jgi:uncharacterized protein YbaR (Trm112 family)
MSINNCPECHNKLELIGVDKETPENLKKKYSVYSNKSLQTLSFFKCHQCGRDWTLDKIKNIILRGTPQKQTCQRCNHEWVYTGSKLKDAVSYPQFIQCPKCKTSVKLLRDY